jgi:hypothetical protein
VTVYGSSPVRRARRTQAALSEVDQAIVQAVRTEYPVTLRGVYYRVVSAGAVDKTEAGYKLVERELKKLRRDGTVPYSRIVDGTRVMYRADVWDDANAMVSDMAHTYRRALWRSQDDEVIVLSEKDAITGVIYPITDKYQVELGIVRGYSSVTFTHSIADTINDNSLAGKTTYLYQLGDHDPSGVDAWRSFRHTVEGFVHFKDAVVFERLAVTPEQISQFQLPTRPTKQSDSRAAKFSGESVEVDALPPTVLRRLVEDAIRRHIDERALGLTEMVEEQERRGLLRLAGSWQPDDSDGAE